MPKNFIASGFPANIFRALSLFFESRKRSILLFLRNSGRKTASHFSWNCSGIVSFFESDGSGQARATPGRCFYTG